eukprot:SM000285S10793  [mRNA]  locus=s285:106904:108544:+ [translate_table: standard]
MDRSRAAFETQGAGAYRSNGADPYGLGGGGGGGAGSGGAGTATSYGGAGAGSSSTGPHAGLFFLLRFFQFLLSLLAWIIMAATNHFDHFDAFSFLLAIAFLTSLYTAAVGAAALCKLCASSKYWGTSMLFWQLCGDYCWLTLTTISFDPCFVVLIEEQMFMMLLFAASCAGAASTTQASKGKISYCDSVGHNFCAKTEASVALSFLASFFLIASFWMLVRSTHSRAY